MGDPLSRVTSRPRATGDPAAWVIRRVRVIRYAGDPGDPLAWVTACGRLRHGPRGVSKLSRGLAGLAAKATRA
jgi:hypothetical protein